MTGMTMLAKLHTRVINILDANRWAYEETVGDMIRFKVRVPLGDTSKNAVINIWSTGTVQVQGQKDAAEVVRIALNKDGL